MNSLALEQAFVFVTLALSGLAAAAPFPLSPRSSSKSQHSVTCPVIFFLL